MNCDSLDKRISFKEKEISSQKILLPLLYVFVLSLQEYYVIREWLLPSWLMAVQAFVTLALMFSLSAQILLACVIVRWPLRTVLQYEWIFVSLSFILVAVSSKFYPCGLSLLYHS